MRQELISVRRSVFLIIFVAVVVLSAYIRLSLVKIPLFRDEGNYGTTSQIIYSGGMPYRDIEDNKPPGLYYLYVAAQKIFGLGSGPGVRIFAAFFSLGTLLLLFFIARLMKSELAGLAAAFFFGIFSSSLTLFGYMALSEVFILTAVCLGYLLYLLSLRCDDAQQNKRRLYLIVAGISLGAAFTIKQVGVYFMMGLLIFHIVRNIYRREKQGLLNTLLLLGGFGMVLFGLFVYLASCGILHEYFRCNVELSYILAHTFPEDLAGTYANRLGTSLVEVFIREKGILFLAILSALFIIKGGRNMTEERLFLGMWFLFALLGVFSSGMRFNDYYYLIVLPPLCIMAALCLQMLACESSKRVTYAALILIAGFCLYYGVSSYAPRTVAKICQDMRGAEEVGAYVRDNSRGEDLIYEWGIEFQVYFYARRKPASRHINLYHLIVLAHSDEDRAARLLSEFQNEMIADFTAHPPRFFIISVPNLSIGYRTRRIFITSFVDQLLKKHYTFDRRIGSYDIFRRRDAEATTFFYFPQPCSGNDKYGN